MPKYYNKLLFLSNSYKPGTGGDACWTGHFSVHAVVS